MKVAFFSSKSYDEEYFTNVNKTFDHKLHFFETRLDAHTVKLAKGYQAVCIFVNDKADAHVMRKLSQRNIKLLALRCAGFNNVDLDAAEKYGITVLRVPAYSPRAVAEHALALILTLNRKTHKAYNRIREGNFSLERLTGFNVSGKTIGVVGSGAIGRAFIQLLKGFEPHFLAFDPYPNEQLKNEGVEYVSLEKLLSESDIISLHCPLSPETHKMINAQNLKYVKQGAMLINTSRGKLIDTEAVIDSLRKKQLGSLGIDVYAEEEKLFFKDLSEMIIDDDTIARLISLPNVLVTAHQAFLTREALEQIAETTLQNISDFNNGQIAETNHVGRKHLGK
ncbi:D-lactate dehydrogenase [Mariniphaga anaerophila]|uniref:D-lactate dehydrogenase n=1 Tax=Mariniphaga anaerophila TaxID=1484053 RepID=A0A1M4YRT6_9BACT|nr:2-hydroxyacid dehydrogenase [Mariniphaga anaerophila]SHF08222.1 D-lactate dehydrogenase [Mariniphaga anaerophila]